MIERILKLMEKEGIKASDLTGKIGLNHSAITDWKQGKSKPSTDAIVKIAEYFGVTTDYLLTGKEPSHDLTVVNTDEIQLLKDYQSLSDKGKETVYDVIRLAAKGEGVVIK